MSKPSKADRPPGLSDLLHGIEQAKHESVAGAPLAPQLALLRDWQVRRLTRTYADLLRDKRYQASCSFFIDDIYAARDFSQRNHDMVHMRDRLSLLMPETLVRPLSMAIELHELTEQLDKRLLDVLRRQLGMTDGLSVAMYAEAYRRCDNRGERKRQIEMITELGNRVEALVNLPFSGTVLKLARAPAASAGQGGLAIFLERGYNAFKRMHGAKKFLNTVHERELQILERIYASDPDPFGFGAGDG